MVVTARMANAHKLFNHIQHTVSYQTFTNELCQLWSYWTKVHEIFTRYRPRGIICAVNAHIEVAISHSISECQSDESGEFAIFHKIGYHGNVP